MQYPKDSTYSKKPCANHKLTDCSNKQCGFNHALCTHYARNRCTRKDCAFPHRLPSSVQTTSRPITNISRAVSTTSQCVPVTQNSIQNHETSTSNVAFKHTLTEEEEFMLECELEFDNDDDDDDEDFNYDECVEDENGVAIPLKVFYDDVILIWSQVLKDFGFESESQALEIFVQNYMTNYGATESDSRVFINRIHDVNPLVLCEWVLTGSEWDRESIDDYYMNTLLSNDKSNSEAREIIGLFYKHYHKKTFGVNEDTTNEA